MKLEDFVAETLKQVVAGVKNAQGPAKENGAYISPFIQRNETTTSIDFDVEVTTSDATETEGGIGVFVGAIGLGSKGKSDSSTVSVNRIKFSIPLFLPPTNTKGRANF